MPSTAPIKIQVVFRGDDRHPLEDHVFTSGLHPKKPQLKDGSRPNKTSRVCVSNQLAVAALFPFTCENKDIKSWAHSNTWIYILRVPETEDYNHYTKENLLPMILSEETIKETREQYQLWDTLRRSKTAALPGSAFRQYQSIYQPFINHLERRFRLLYGDEANVEKVLSPEIVGAIRCERKFSKKSGFDGGIFRLHEYISNPNYLDAKIAQQTRQQMSALSYKWMQMPMPGNAFSNMDKDILDKLNAEPPFKSIMLGMQEKAEQSSKNNNRTILTTTPYVALDSIGFWCRPSEKKLTEKETAIPANEVRANDALLHTYKR
jgi:hypothetical protein